jgi:hypothetical protein
MPDEAFLQSIERRGADITEDDAQRAQRQRGKASVRLRRSGGICVGRWRGDPDVQID